MVAIMWTLDSSGENNELVAIAHSKEAAIVWIENNPTDRGRYWIQNKLRFLNEGQNTLEDHQQCRSCGYFA